MSQNADSSQPEGVVFDDEEDQISPPNIDTPASDEPQPAKKMQIVIEEDDEDMAADDDNLGGFIEGGDENKNPESKYRFVGDEEEAALDDEDNSQKQKDTVKAQEQKRINDATKRFEQIKGDLTTMVQNLGALEIIKDNLKTYRVTDDCVQHLQAMQEMIFEDQDRQVWKQIYKWDIIQNDLFKIITSYRDFEEEVVVESVKLLCQMTVMPKGPRPLAVKGLDYASQLAICQQIKMIFLREREIFTSLCMCVNKRKEHYLYSVNDEGKLVLDDACASFLQHVLHLLVNLAKIPDATQAVDTTNVMQELYVTRLKSEGAFDLLATLMSEMTTLLGERRVRSTKSKDVKAWKMHWVLVLIELLSHLIKNESASDLFLALAEEMDEIEQNTAKFLQHQEDLEEPSTPLTPSAIKPPKANSYNKTLLLNLMQQENRAMQQRKQKAPLRHTRFAGLLQVKNGDTSVVHQSSALEANKVFSKEVGKPVIRKAKLNVHDDQKRTSLDVKRILRFFTMDVLKNYCNVLFEYLWTPEFFSTQMEAPQREPSFIVARFMLELNRCLNQHKWEKKKTSDDVLVEFDPTCVHGILDDGVVAFLSNSIKEQLADKQWKQLSISVGLFKEIIMSLEYMLRSSNFTYQQWALRIIRTFTYEQENVNMILNICKAYQPYFNSRHHLQQVVELIHVFFRMIEFFNEFFKSALVIKKKKVNRKKKQQQDDVEGIPTETDMQQDEEKEDDNNDEQDAPVSQEKFFDHATFVHKFASNKIVEKYIHLLDFHVTNGPTINHYIISMLQRICGPCDKEILLFDSHVLKLFNDMLTDKAMMKEYESSSASTSENWDDFEQCSTLRQAPAYKVRITREVVDFAVKVMKDLQLALRENPSLAVTLLTKKSSSAIAKYRKDKINLYNVSDDDDDTFGAYENDPLDSGRPKKKHRSNNSTTLSHSQQQMDEGEMEFQFDPPPTALQSSPSARVLRGRKQDEDASVEYKMVLEGESDNDEDERIVNKENADPLKKKQARDLPRSPPATLDFLDDE